ncbi:hypothetical protein EV421DRAFT_1966251 [Armillaria borealis]|uniref:Uncharacterized protein n=1 Tax=Armillaria borealis TaxID=47425 RepID=A0AA39JAE8_9AGAR|nr:hypothetical protein EV421DRAFT_1966251 [Armillaria borealis]
MAHLNNKSLEQTWIRHQCYLPLHRQAGSAQSTREYTRPCRCGKSECMWQFIYLDQMILATHKVLGSLPPIPTRHASSMNPPPPKLSSRQKETFYLTSVEGSIFNIHKTFATPIIQPDHDCDDSEAGLLRFLKRKPWGICDRTSWFVWGVGATLALAVPGAGCGIGIYARVLIT